jgi:hypothetical protein
MVSDHYTSWICNGKWCHYIFLCHQSPCMQHYISMLASPQGDTKYWHIPQTLAYFASLPLFLVFLSSSSIFLLSFPSSIVVYVLVIPFLIFTPFLSIYYPFPFHLVPLSFPSIPLSFLASIVVYVPVFPFLIFIPFLHLLPLNFPSSTVVYVPVFSFLIFIPFPSIHYPFPFLLLSSYMCQYFLFSFSFLSSLPLTPYPFLLISSFMCQ